MLRPDQKERLLKLGEEQLAIAEKWEKEKEERGKIFDEIATLFGNPDKEARFHELVEQVSQSTPDFCEHGRSIWKPCGACNEIEMALNPEFYDEEGERLPDEVVDAIVEADPERYGIPRNEDGPQKG